jgi:serine/threonine-protein kinase
VKVERGHLLLYRCRLTSTGPAEPGGGLLITFNAPGSLPLPRPSWADKSGSWPFDRETDRPTCRITETLLLSAGDAIRAEVGRGLVVLGQCLVTAGGTAFALAPGKVARHRLDADLWLDHCTLSAETTFLSLGAWAGSEPGPDRPWLVNTRRCVFFGMYARPARESVLLRVEPESMAHGALLWQASGDAFEVPVFTATAQGPVPDGVRPDVSRQWVDLWGASHVRGATGPRLPFGSPSVRPVTRLRAGHVEPADLHVDPTYPPEAPASRELGADLARLGIPLPSRGGRRR